MGEIVKIWDCHTKSRVYGSVNILYVDYVQQLMKNIPVTWIKITSYPTTIKTSLRLLEELEKAWNNISKILLKGKAEDVRKFSNKLRYLVVKSQLLRRPFLFQHPFDPDNTIPIKLD